MNLPYAIEAEEALIGAVFMDPSIPSVYKLDSSEFYIHRNGWVWESFLSLLKQGLPIDLVTVADELDKSGKLKELGGSAYLTKLATSCPSAFHAKGYAERVKETAVRRKGIQKATQFVSALHDETKPVEESIQSHVEDVGKIRVGASSRMKSADQVSDEFIEKLMSDNISMLWGIGGMDGATGGKELQTLIVLAGRPGMGKSALALQAARNDSINHRVGFFQLEMSASSMWARVACPSVGVEWKDVKARNITEQQRKDLVNASIELAARYKDLYIDDTPGLTTSQIYQRTIENNLDIIYVDHVKLVGNKGDNENLRVGGASMHLKEMAKALDIPVVMLAQLNRGLENRKDKRPTLSDLRDSGEIEQNADDVLMMYRESYYDEDADDTTQIFIRKFRNGDSNAKINLKFDKENQWFNSKQHVITGEGFNMKVKEVPVPDYIHE